MSCSVCNGYPGCPCCSEDSTVNCSNCQGDGKIHIYYNEHTGIDVSREVWEADKENHIHETEICFVCGGDGYIEQEDCDPRNEYEPEI